MTPLELLEAAEVLLGNIATEFHKDAAVSVQFSAGAWQKFQALVKKHRGLVDGTIASPSGITGTGAPSTDPGCSNPSGITGTGAPQENPSTPTNPPLV